MSRSPARADQPAAGDAARRRPAASRSGASRQQRGGDCDGEAEVIQLRRAEKRSESVARAILHDIASRQLEEGTPLGSEGNLVETFGVGRSTLREAIRILELNGLLGLRPGPGGGPYVKRAGAESFTKMSTLQMQAMGLTVGDVLDARSAFEPMIARRAAACDDEASRARLADVVEYLTKRKSTGTAPPPVDFHGCLISMAGLPVLELLGHMLADVVLLRLDATFTPRQVAQMRKDHIAIGQAVLERDGDAAERLMHEHYVRISTIFRANCDVDQRIEWS